MQWITRRVWACIGSIKLGSIKLGSIKLGSIKLGSIKLGSIKLGSVGAGSIGPRSLRAGSLRAASIAVASIVVASTLSGCGRAPTPPATGTPAPSPAPTPATPGATPGATPAQPTIAVIPKGTTHVFWKSVERGAQRAGDELGARIIWKGPLTENDRAQQIQLVQQFLTQGVDGLVLAPLDYKALVPSVRAAQERGIPVVIFDSELEGTPGRDFVSFVATNNQSAGRLGGDHLASLLGGAGDVVLLRYQVGSASTDNRERGFLDAVSAHESINVISDNRYAGATAGEAKTAAVNMVDMLQAAEGIFCPNESSTYGMLLALRQQGLAGKVRFVGFDASPPLIEALRAGEIDALVVQDPQTMGYRAVVTLLAHRRGEAVEAVVDTGAVVVSRQNLDDPDIRRLLE